MNDQALRSEFQAFSESSISDRQSRSCTADFPSTGSPSMQERFTIAILGIISVTAGGSMFFLKVENRGWPMVAAVIFIWLGLLLLLVLWNSNNRKTEELNSTSCYDSVSNGNRQDTSTITVGGVLNRLAKRTESKSAILLRTEGANWRLLASWNCSDTFGNLIASSLEGRAPRDVQTIQYLSLMDAAISSFCSPIHLNANESLMLVLLNDAKLPIHYSAPSLSLLESSKILDLIKNAESLGDKSKDASQETTPNSITCCTVCDSIYTADGSWIRWTEWLNKRQEMAVENTFCHNCEQWVYGYPSIGAP